MEDKNKANNEYSVHTKAYSLVPCPKIIDYYTENNQIIFIMELLDGCSLYELYGDNPKNIPSKIWKEIHNIIPDYCLSLHSKNHHFLTPSLNHQKMPSLLALNRAPYKSVYMS